METKIIEWKNAEIYVNGETGKAAVYGQYVHIHVYDSLKDAFKAINKVTPSEPSQWDKIKEAVKAYKNMNRHYKRAHLGDDAYGLDNEMRLDAYYDSVYEFLQDCKCLHMIYSR